MEEMKIKTITGSRIEPITCFRFILITPEIDSFMVSHIKLPRLTFSGEKITLSDPVEAFEVSTYVVHETFNQLSSFLGKRVENVDIKFLSSDGHVITKWSLKDCVFDPTISFFPDMLDYYDKGPLMINFCFRPSEILIS